MKITVAICTYQRSRLLKEALEGAVGQDYPADDLELLVVDNNSTDGTRAVVESFADARFPPRWILETRQGLDHARNRALAEARGEIVVFADDDILVRRDWIRELVAPFAGDPAGRIGCVGGEVTPVFPEGAPDWIVEGHSPLGFRAEAGPLRPDQVPMGANLAVSKAALERTGPFAAGLDRSGGRLFSGGDAELVARVRAAGFEVWFAPVAAVRHQMPASRATLRYAARHAFDSARSRVIERAGRPGAAAYLLSRLAGNLAKAAGFAFAAAAAGLLLRKGASNKFLVRAWRACGYLYQIPRSLCGKV